MQACSLPADASMYMSDPQMPEGSCSWPHHHKGCKEAHGAWLQIASALSRPEEATARAMDTAGASLDIAPEAESLLSPDETLHSIHEEPEEAATGHGDAQPQIDQQASSGADDLAQQGHSRRPSFTHAPGTTDRQNTQPGQHPV